jgi:cephalosporin hydroxylase
MTNSSATSDPHQEFREEVANRIQQNRDNVDLRAAAREFNKTSNELKYSYNFEWLGRPIIQYPQDMIALQEIIFNIKPDLIIETGIARGGSLIFYASILALLDILDAAEKDVILNPRSSSRLVIGVDIDIRPHNRLAIEAHPMSSRIQIVEGSSVDKAIIHQVHQLAASHKKVMVCLDSNHTHDHVLAELESYASLTTRGSYCIVFDTIVDDLPRTMYPNRPWGPGNSPKSAVVEYLKVHSEFQIDRSIEDKLQITVAPGGYLRRVA